MPHPGQTQIISHPARFKVVACGRRFGKTETGKLILLEKALHGATCWWLAPTYQMATDVWRALKMATRPLPLVDHSEAERRIAFNGGGSVTIRSTHNPDNLRGAGLDYAILDEAAFMAPDVWANVVRPMLLERRGGALFLSTPFGRNWFWEIFKLGLDYDEPEWASFQFQSIANPLVDENELATIRRNTPERVFREEYLAEFIDDAGQVFRGVYEVATAPENTIPQPDRHYVMGVDWGRDHDYTALAVIDADTGALVALDRFNQIGWALQRGRLQALYDRWHPQTILAEANSIGTVNIEALQSLGLPVRPFMTTSRTKRPLIEGLALAIERGEIALLPDAVLLAELVSYEMTRLQEGGYKYGAPAGGHDDTVIATALAWHAARSSGLRVDFA